MRPARTLLLLALLALAAAPTVVRGQDCGPDCLGLYFDEAGTTWCLPGAAISTFAAYLILSDPTMDAVAGLSIFFVLEGPVVVTGVNFGSPVICEPAEPGAYCTVWSPPRPTTGPTVLATVNLFYSGLGTPALIGVRNSGPPADDRPWVLLPDETMTPLNPAAGAGQPLAQLGGDCVIVPTADRGWGAVKALYR